MTDAKRVVVITGANGLLGRRLVAMLAPSHTVCAVVHSAPKDPIPGANYLVIDFSRDWDVADLPSSPDSVVHLAQSANFRNVPERALDVFQVNIASTARLLDYAWRAGAQRFVYASSGGIYAGGHQHAFRENSPIVQPGTLGYYLGSKVSCEALASSYARLMNVMIMRFFFIYGHGQNRSMLIPRLVDNMRAGRPIQIQGSDGLRINPIHVDDAAKAVVASLMRDSSAIYNIAGPQVLSLRSLCEQIEGCLGVVARYENCAGEPTDVVGDISLMRAELHNPGILPAVGLRDVL